MLTASILDQKYLVQRKKNRRKFAFKVSPEFFMPQVVNEEVGRTIQKQKIYNNIESGSKTRTIY